MLGVMMERCPIHSCWGRGAGGPVLLGTGPWWELRVGLSTGSGPFLSGEAPISTGRWHYVPTGVVS